jgi:crotonobetainyl-CoA:carnitine CoA-transferase CaiB-like acyl-CoA transferase
MNFYRCKDGKWLFLSLMQADRYWPDFCQALGRADLETDSRFDDSDRRKDNREELISVIEEVFATRTCAEWVSIFQEFRDFIYEPVNSVTDLLDDPQVLANNYIVDFLHPSLGSQKVVNVPVTYSETPGGIRLPAPECGQHTEEVLTEVCGYSWEEVAELREAEVI